MSHHADQRLPGRIALALMVFFVAMVALHAFGVWWLTRSGDWGPLAALVLSDVLIIWASGVYVLTRSKPSTEESRRPSVPFD